jgi:cytochrome P450
MTAARAISAGALPFNPFQISFLDDPYPQYRLLRDAQPRYWVPGCLGRDWVFTRYRDVQSLLSDSRASGDDLPSRIRREAGRESASASVRALCEALDPWLFFVDGDEHRHLHRFVARRFSQGSMSALTAGVTQAVDELLDGVEAAASAPVDIVRALSRPLPPRVAAAVLGWDDQISDDLALLSQDLFSAFTQPSTLARYQWLDERTREFRQRAEAFLTRKAHDHADDLGTDLARAHAGGELTWAQAVGLTLMIFSVGQDTTQHLVSNALYALLQNPEQLRSFREHPERAQGAVRELARFDTPVQVVVHVARARIEIEDVTVEAGERIHCFLGAAHRDPEVFEEPDRLDLDRRASGRLMFGTGSHFCLGAHLALLQAEVALTRLLQRFPGLEAAPTPPRRMRAVHMRGFASLPVLVR